MPDLATTLTRAEPRLLAERNIWLVTVRPTDPPRPHMVPLWFVWLPAARKLYVCTGGDSVKARNVRVNPRVTVALENGDDPVILEGTMERIEEIPSGVKASFAQKYEWDITTSVAENALFEINVERALAWTAS